MPVGQSEKWVLLAYRLPRLPSAPRSAVWRKLKRLGVAQLADGLVALPADARTREHLEWVAEEVTDHGGEAAVWLGHPLDPATDAAIIKKMTAAVAAEYDAVTAQAREARSTDEHTRRRAVARLRRELHRIAGRDFFPPAGRDTARAAVEELAALLTPPVRA